MRLIVEVRWGRMQGSKAVLEPGQEIAVGRSELADFVIAHDPRVSARHFTIAWDGSTCRVADLDSAKGTYINGEILKSGTLEHGDWMRAGDTVFSVFVEGATPPPDEGPGPRWDAKAFDRRENRDKALRVLKKKENLFAVLDASRGRRVLELLREAPEEHRSLFEGVQADAMEEVAPYVVGLPPGSRLLEALVREGWGKRWGIYMTAPVRLAELRKHLRGFLRVEREATGEALYFRFYDPGVLRVFVPTCSPRQRSELFGPIKAFWVEGEDLGAPIRFDAEEARALAAR